MLFKGKIIMTLHDFKQIADMKKQILTDEGVKITNILENTFLLFFTFEKFTIVTKLSQIQYFKL